LPCVWQRLLWFLVILLLLALLYLAIRGWRRYAV
jgi:hypothetical protein